MSSYSTGVKALDAIDNILYNLDDALNPGSSAIPRHSFPNTSLDFQCRKFTTLFKHVRGQLDYLDFQFVSTTLRVKYPKESVAFFVEKFGMTLLDTKVFTELGVTHYFLASAPPPNFDVSRYNGSMLHLRYDHGAAEDSALQINNGNVEPHRGFGHIALNTADVYASCAELEGLGAAFQKKPNEGRMKGLAFALDPNGYWIEVVKRSPTCDFGAHRQCQYNLSQTMLRIKNPEASLKFYCDLMGMRLIAERHFEKGQFSLYFLSSFVDGVEIDGLSGSERWDLMKGQFHPVLELTHNWGTEADDAFAYHDGNAMSALGKGFVSISFLVDDLKAAVRGLKQNGAEMKEVPKYMEERVGTTGFTFLLDPDEYTVELLQRGESPIDPHQKKGDE